MSFGYGVGDFLAVLNLTRKLYKAFKDAPGEFSEISRELQSFHIVVAELEEQAGDEHSELNRFAVTRRPELVSLRDSLLATMKELEDLHERYKQMGRISWSRFRLGQEDLASMRSRLAVQISAVNTFVSSLSMGALRRMEPMLQQIFMLLNERAREDVVMAHTILTANIEDESDGASWAMIELELRSDGVPSAYIHENRERINEILGSVIELNNLSQEDTILPDDSISQLGQVETDVTGTPGENNPRSNTNPRLPARIGKMKSMPYDEWIQKLSRDQDAARMKLSRNGFQIRDLDDEQAVCWAAASGEQTALQLLLERGHDPYAERDGVSAPLLAAHAGHWHLVLLMFEPQRIIPARTKCLIHVAAAANHCDIIGILLDLGVDINLKSQPSKESPLQKAVVSGSFEAAELLLRRGADTSKRTSNGTSLLSLTVDNIGSARCVDIFRLLLDMGADPNGRYDGLRYEDWPLLNFLARGWTTALYPGSDVEDNLLKEKQTDIAILLVKAGASIEDTVGGGKTPLHMAIDHSNKRLAIILLKRSANVNAENGFGCLAIHLATMNSDVEMVEILLNYGCNINARDGNGFTPLHLAVKFSNERMVGFFLKNGSDTIARDSVGDTPLHLAVKQSTPDMVRYLMKKNPKAETEMNNHGETPLHLAIVRGSNDTVECFIGSGANVNIPEFNEETPLQYAYRVKNYEAASILERYKRE